MCLYNSSVGNYLEVLFVKQISILVKEIWRLVSWTKNLPYEEIN